MKVMKLVDKRKKIAAQAEELKELKLRFTERNETITKQAAEIETLKADRKASDKILADTQKELGDVKRGLAELSKK